MTLRYLLDTKMSATQTNQLSWLMRPTGTNSFAGRKCLIAIHGRTALGSHPAVFTDWMNHCRSLVEAGYVVLGIDCGAQSGTTNGYTNPWGNDAAMTAITNPKTY